LEKLSVFSILTYITPFENSEFSLPYFGGPASNTGVYLFRPYATLKINPYCNFINKQPVTCLMRIIP
jgi:hypothetical protein